MSERVVNTFFALLLAGPIIAGAQQPAQQGGADTMPNFVRRAITAHPQPGDRIYVHVWREPKLSDTVTVDERGDVALPKVGIVNAASFTIGALRDTVRSRFAEFLRDSPVDLVVLRRVAVNGEVAKPDVYYVDVTTTLRDVIALAGGINDNGSPNKVMIIRDAERIPVRDWQRDRSATSDLRSGDQVVVGRKSWIAINALPALSVSAVVASLIISLSRK